VLLMNCAGLHFLVAHPRFFTSRTLKYGNLYDFIIVVNRIDACEYRF
jgi:hypothetical protein